MANDKFQNALARRPQKTPPVWFMRQAGRYHRHYQGLRSKHSFMELCKVPELAAEVALGPIEDFDFDVSILFSDLLFPLEALGMGLEYNPAPTLGWQLSPQTIHKLSSVEESLEGVAFQKQAALATRERLPKSKSLIGFVGGPWTLFTYAVEGAHKGNLLNAKNQFELFDKFCDIMVPFLIGNIQLQLEGGVEVVMVFDTAAGELSPQLYRQFVVPQLKKLAAAYPNQLGYYSKGTTLDHLPDLVEDRQWAGLGVDHRWLLPQFLQDNQTGGFSQGNFDQALLFADPATFRRRLDEFLRPFEEMTLEQRAGWVCGLGHGVLPATPEDNVRSFVEIVRERFR